MASGRRPSLSTQAVLDKLYTEWSGRENPNSILSSLDEFLTKFHAALKAQFEIKASITKGFLRGKFIISSGKQQAFLFKDISSGRLFFTVNPNESGKLQTSEGSFYVVCGAFCKYLEETTKPGQTYSYAELAKSFVLGKQQLGQKQGLVGIGCSDVISRLIRNNFLLISYTKNVASNQKKVPNKSGNKRDTTVPQKKSSNKENVDQENVPNKIANKKDTTMPQKKSSNKENVDQENVPNKSANKRDTTQPQKKSSNKENVDQENVPNKSANKKDTTKPQKKSSNEEYVDPELLLDRVWRSFRKYINDLNKSQVPHYRYELEALYNHEFKLHKQTFDSKVEPDCEKVPFHKVVSKLKANKFLKFVGGQAEIEYIFANQEMPQNQPKWKEPPQKKCPIRVRKKNYRTEKVDVEELAADRNGVHVYPVDSEEEQKELASREISEAETEKMYQEMIEGVVNFDSVLMSDSERKCKIIRIEFKPEERNQKMTYVQCDLIDNLDEVFSVGDPENIKQGKKVVDMYQYGQTYDVNLYYRSKCIGFQTSVLILSFKIGKEIFQIFRFLQGETRNLEMEEIFPTEPHIPMTGRNKRVTEDLEVCEAPKFDSKSKSKGPLPLYRSPLHFDWFLEILEREVEMEKEALRAAGKDENVDESKVWRKICVDYWKHYGSTHFEEKLHQLLYFEELQWEYEMGRYDMKNVEMDKKRHQFSLLVPGLAENRPSLLPGDLVTVSVQAEGDDGPGNIEYKGVITTIEAERILLDFDQSFGDQFIKGQKHHVRFGFNRRILRLMHRAIDMKHDLVRQKAFPSLTFNKKPFEGKPLLEENALANIRLFDKKIEGNEQQLTAVKNILRGSSRPYPYIIYGPPGTGKTVTCVEAMKQVLKVLPKSRILACAPSNYAADLILHRLLHPHPIPKNEFFRLNAQSRSVKTLPKEYKIEGFCKIVDGERFEIPSWEELENYRVIICTMTTAGRMVCMGAPREHFTHIFMDECGQAMEPETYIPLAGLFDARNKDGGLVVMAGDPKQLGPVVMSPVARQEDDCFPRKKKEERKSNEEFREHGLETSLLERLMNRSNVYQRMPSVLKSDTKKGSKLHTSVPGDILSPNSWSALADEDAESEDSDTVSQVNSDQPCPAKRQGPYNANYITKLLRNYRSHQSIIEIPNELFYEKELVPCADPFKINSLCQWKHLPTRGFPIIFHGVEGQDLREGNSPSFFNAEEAAEVVKYVRILLDEKGLGVSPDQIGVISPYRKQTQKIRKLLEKDLKRPRMSELKVGAVEEFQGDERRIIILSTNRCTVEYLKKDAKHHLGFLCNPKRFNVAITRAQALLIIVGNPFVLSRDKPDEKERKGNSAAALSQGQSHKGPWNEFINFCIENDGYKGCVYTADWEEKIADELAVAGRKQADEEEQLGKWRK
eukprot:Seg1318.2 transcript_id=Seg1318.2/GoldUCD/mRNA.D3Y31 product="putative helicase MOV-10" protein_id=Seg1318.2/GoldUCD/D3Y31